MLQKKLLLLAAVIFGCLAQSSAQCARATVIANYQNVYLPSSVSTSELGWTGNTAGCTPGTISQLAQTRTLTRINYFRQLCGLPGNITFDATLNTKCQQAALMMSANSSLSHNPPNTWLCYTADGASAAGSSNLSLGSYASSAISSYMNDGGSGNTAVGHRRWLLYSRATTFGHGATSNADALWVTGNSAPAPSVNFVAFPSSGFFPAPLVPFSERWSFSKPGADFSSATVEMKDPAGTIVPVVLEPLSNSYGDRTIVWKPTGVVTNSPTDITYSVKVANVMVNNIAQDFNYTVTICQPVHPPTCPTGMSWSEAQCSCIFATDISSVSLKDRIKAVNPFSNELKITIEAATQVITGLSVHDITGRRVITEPSIMTAGQRVELKWETGNWERGVYFITLFSGKGNKDVIKVIKQF